MNFQSENSPSIVISGSFRRHYDAIKVAIKEFESLGIKVLSPRSSEIINLGEEVAILATDETKDIAILEKRHLAAIEEADALYLCNPQGYLGASSILELGWAIARGKLVFCSDIPTDPTLLLFSGNIASPREVKDVLSSRASIVSLNEQSSLPVIQQYIHEMVVRRGFEGETPRDVMLLLVEEIGELAKALRKHVGLKIDKEKEEKYPQLEGELADVFIYILSLANSLNISLYDAFYTKEQENEKRHWK